VRKIRAAIAEWDDYFALMNYAAPLPNVTRAIQWRSDAAKYNGVPEVVLALLDPLQLKEMEDTVTNSTARYALLAYHALVLHAQGMHEKEEVIYECLSAIETQDWPMKRDAMLNQIRCLRERHGGETEPAGKVNLCQQIVRLVEMTTRILKDHYSESEWTRSTLIRDERDFLLLASMEAKLVLGIPHSDEEEALLGRAERRRRRRQHGAPYLYGKFRHDHGAALSEFRKQYRPIWLRNRYRQHYGQEPQNEPITTYPSGGWSIHPDYIELDDMQAFARDAENRYRESIGLPLRGQGWSSETYLKLLVKKVAVPLEVFFEHAPSWLYPQRFDIFIPDLGLAIEYMGEQHYWEIEYFGGREGFEERKELDSRKRVLAQANAVTVLDWRYDEDISEAAVEEKLSRYSAPRASD
jgi:hypothetical protein